MTLKEKLENAGFVVTNADIATEETVKSTNDVIVENLSNQVEDLLGDASDDVVSAVLKSVAERYGIHNHIYLILESFCYGKNLLAVTTSHEDALQYKGDDKYISILPVYDGWDDGKVLYEE